MDKKFDFEPGEILTPSHDVRYQSVNILKGEKYRVIKAFKEDKNLLLENIETGAKFRAHYYWLNRIGLDFYRKKLKKLLFDNKIREFD